MTATITVTALTARARGRLSTVSNRKQPLECRIVVTRHRHGGRVSMGMYDPASGRYEPLGDHGPDERDIEKAIGGLATSIERAGHRLTWCERTA